MPVATTATPRLPTAVLGLSGGLAAHALTSLADDVAPARGGQAQMHVSRPLAMRPEAQRRIAYAWVRADKRMINNEFLKDRRTRGHAQGHGGASVHAMFREGDPPSMRAAGRIRPAVQRNPEPAACAMVALPAMVTIRPLALALPMDQAALNLPTTDERPGYPPGYPEPRARLMPLYGAQTRGAPQEAGLTNAGSRP